MKTYNASPKVLLFFTDAVTMLVAMTAAGTLLSFCRSVMTVWTWMTVALLLAAYMAHPLGCRLVRHHYFDPVVCRLICLTAGWMLAVGMFGDAVTGWLAMQVPMTDTGAVAAILSLFLPPSVALCTASSLLVRKIFLSDRYGTLTYNTRGIRAAGGIAGTLAGGLLTVSMMKGGRPFCLLAFILGWLSYGADRCPGSFLLAVLMTFLAVFLFFELKYYYLCGTYL